MNHKFLSFCFGGAVLTLSILFASSCSSERVKNQSKEAAAKFWQDKAYPGKAYDVQVIEAEKAEDGKYRVKGLVDGETRVGLYNPETETFSEGYYSLAHERNRRVAELEQEVKYWKEKTEALEKEIYKLKVQLKFSTGSEPTKESEPAKGLESTKGPEPTQGSETTSKK